MEAYPSDKESESQSDKEDQESKSVSTPRTIHTHMRSGAHRRKKTATMRRIGMPLRQKS